MWKTFFITAATIIACASAALGLSDHALMVVGAPAFSTLSVLVAAAIFLAPATRRG